MGRKYKGVFRDNKINGVECTQSSNVPIQDNWRAHSVGHRMWDISKTFDEFDRERKRRPVWEVVWDWITHKGRRINDLYWNIKGGLRSLRKWLPVIWADRQWDHSFICHVLEHKLQMILKYRRDPKSSYMAHVGEEKVNRDIQIMAECIHRLGADEYCWIKDDALRKRRDMLKHHQPWDDLQIGPFPKQREYEAYMQKQDLATFARLFQKNLLRLWD